MKGYEDLVAGLLLLVVVLAGGYYYLNSEVIKQQREVMQYPKKQEVKSFESKVKVTE